MLPLQWCLPIFCAGSLWLAWPRLAPLWGLVGACLPALPASLGGALGALLCAVGCAGSRHALACLDLPAASAVGKSKHSSVCVCAGPAPPVAAFVPHCASGLWGSGPLVRQSQPPTSARCLPAFPRPAALCRPPPARGPPPPALALRPPVRLPHIVARKCICGSIGVSSLASPFRIWCIPIWCMPCLAVSFAYVQP